MQHGIGISTQKLNTMKLSKDGKTVSLGGGVKSGQVERFLSAQGKRSGEYTTSDPGPINSLCVLTFDLHIK